MTSLDTAIESEILATGGIQVGDPVEPYSPSLDEVESIRIEAHTDVPPVDVVVDVDVDIDIDAIAVIDVDVDVDIDVDTPHIDQP